MFPKKGAGVESSPIVGDVFLRGRLLGYGIMYMAPRFLGVDRFIILRKAN